MVSSQMVIAILVLLLAQAWFFGSSRRSGGVGFPITGPERLAAYEAIWQKEEADLWEWLEDRVGLDDGLLGRDQLGRRQQVLKSHGMGRKLTDERMSERQMNDAIRSTQERLNALKDAVGRRKATAGIKK